MAIIPTDDSVSDDSVEDCVAQGPFVHKPVWVIGIGQYDNINDTTTIYEVYHLMDDIKYITQPMLVGTGIL